MRNPHSFWVLAAVLLFGGGAALAEPDKKPPKEIASFGSLRAMDPETARGKALDWLKGVGKTDEATQKAFGQLWQENRPVLDKVTLTFKLGDPAAGKLLDEVQASEAAAPTEVPALLKDGSKPAFFRANLALAYARALAQKRVYEEVLDVLNLLKAEQVVDPAAYLFHKAVAEHALTRNKEANSTIIRLLDDVSDAPERYKALAALMVYDMLGWREKDLGAIARKMDNIERRLDLSRGGPQTRKLQKEVLARLDELIKEKENEANGSGGGNGGNCPGGGKPGDGKPGNNTQSSSPQKDSYGGNGSGPGNVDPKKLKEMAEVWGKLPERERAKAMLELTRDMPPHYRELIEKYFKELARAGGDSGSR